MKQNSKLRQLVPLIILVGLLIFCGISVIYNMVYFKKGTRINNIDVSGLKKETAIKKISDSKINYNVYLENKIIYKVNNVSAEITDKDSNELKSILKKQNMLFYKPKNFWVVSKKIRHIQNNEIKKIIALKLKTENKKLRAPQNAFAELKDTKINIVHKKDGTQYDINRIVNEINLDDNNIDINLKAYYLKSKDYKSSLVLKQMQKLRFLKDSSVIYKIHKTPIKFKAEELIKSARYNEGNYQIKPRKIDIKINSLNETYATLGKYSNFKTSDGRLIKVKNMTYGWKINPKKASKVLIEALKNNQREVNAKNTLEKADYFLNGIGYKNISKNISGSYAEISLKKQILYIYKNNQLVNRVHVVTGNHKTRNDTPKGVYYIIYKHINTTLKGKHADGSQYASAVHYWMPFTDDGCGFHDASWRTNWNKNAYLNEGSLGCINLKPNQAKMIYDNLVPGEPVVIY